MDQKPPVKRRNLAETQARIVATAFDLFASRGYARTSLREIATSADVAISLVVRYFGTKSSLFEKALVETLYTRGVFVEDKADFGNQMARRLLDEKNARIPAIMVLSIADPESRDIARVITRDVVIRALADWLGPPDAEGRAFQMLTLLNGFMIQAHHLTAGPIPASSARRLARSLQIIVDEREEAPQGGHTP